MGCEARDVENHVVLWPLPSLERWLLMIPMRISYRVREFIRIASMTFYLLLLLGVGIYMRWVVPCSFFASFNVGDVPARCIELKP